MTQFYLAIDGSTYRGSCAIVSDAGSVVAEAAVAMRGEKEERLMPAVASLFPSGGRNLSDLAGIICGEGPGSFTSLRIAASIAKGLSHGLGIPLYPVSSLLLMVASVQPAPRTGGRYLATLDAMRGELFTLNCVVGADASIVADADVAILAADEVTRLLEGESPDVTGVGAGREIEAVPHARGAVKLLASIIRRGPVDASRWEPNYGRMAEAEARLARAGSRATAP